MDIKLESELWAASQQRLHLGLIWGQVKIEDSSQELKELLQAEIRLVQSQLKLEDLAKLPQLAALRDTYKKLGKKPQKYRGSNEALLRRTVKNLGLYSANNVVDINNLISLRSKRSAGCYDLEKVQGEIRFGVGREGEPYQSIGRGQLNIANLPVFRDALGPFGSPTSDSERTCITLDTQSLLLVIIGFDGCDALEDEITQASHLLKTFAGGKELCTKICTMDGDEA